MGQFSNSFPKHFSYLCEYAIRFDLSCSNCEYPAIFHCLHCSPSCFDPDSPLLAYLWLGLSWIDCISAKNHFSSSRTSSRKPYTSSKQQGRHKHSVEITIIFSHSEQRRPATAHAVGPVLGPHARTDRTRDTRVAEPWLPTPEDGRPGEGQRLTPDAPHNGGRLPPPPGDGPPPPPRHAAPTRHAGQGDSVGLPHPHTRPAARGWQAPTARPVGGQSGEGQRLTSDAPHNGGRHPPPGTPFRHPHRVRKSAFPML